MFRFLNDVTSHCCAAVCFDIDLSSHCHITVCSKNGTSVSIVVRKNDRGHEGCLHPRKNVTDRYGWAHKAFFAYAKT